ncbi:hypothetical protein L202_02503 [Cryptococcus amylolentus CBS 6039]|uniref:Uncharacterized protein n=2 Tax=Cryptococcus amylolentus TaxID=104669 RepID=A0A1E3I1J1_9TREE|nr:hypothetical protein L202_02503 [Cryptococcus amylolentus CBS 6039]ODN82215.1 hypothetical protein L202_02503 [Cryptococcus amylolentus CBS 6039]ODO09702.1 hypothetical protein I350_01916 [Cryptococcus amylolentus CBS 6273]
MSSSAHPLLPPLPARSISSAYFVPSVHEEHTFHPHPALASATKVTLQSAGVGLLVSAVQNALQKHNAGALGVFTRTGSTITLFATMGFSYSYFTSFTANQRETDDALNAAAGGCAAGFIAGVQHKSLPVAVGACAGMAALLGTFSAAGGSFTGVDRKWLPRPQREEIRQSFFKKQQPAGAGADAEEDEE